jgi:hypothetical protein
MGNQICENFMKTSIFMPNQTKFWLFGSRWLQPKLESSQGRMILFCLGCMSLQKFEFDLLE